MTTLAGTFALAAPLYARWAGEDPRRRARAAELEQALADADRARRAHAERLRMPLPETLVIGLTSSCTLRCPGCAAAADFTHAPRSLAPALVDDVLAQSLALGVHRFAMVGGEPLLRRELVVRLLREHRDCLFLIFSNGRLLDDPLAAALAAEGNALVFLNIGASDPGDPSEPILALELTLERLARHGVPFAFAATVTCENLGFLSSTATLDLVLRAGAAGGILFDCLADFDEPSTTSRLGSRERERFLAQARDWARSRGVLLVAVPEDEGLVGGCGAAGRAILHLSPHGTYDPCPFVPYSPLLATRHRLIDALRSPYFEELRRATPAGSSCGGCTYRELRPLVREIAARHGARRNSELAGQHHLKGT